MEYRSLGRTGIQVSTLCLGSMVFGGRADDASSLAIIDRALAEGINFVDTANVYNLGRSEEIVGKAIKQDGKRDRLVLATKVWAVMDPSDPNSGGTHRRHLIQECEASLRRLQTDYIDIYQIHRPSIDIPIDETLRALDDLIHAGKVRYIGASNFSAWEVVESLWVAKEYGLNRFVTYQGPYNLLDRRLERELSPMARTYGLALLAWSPLAMGFLSGKYRSDEAPLAGSRFADNKWGAGWAEADFKRSHFRSEAFDVIDSLKSLGAGKGCTASQLALAWCASQPGMTGVIIGPRTVEQLEDNLGALGVGITDDDRRALDAVAPREAALVSYPLPDAGSHRFHW